MLIQCIKLQRKQLETNGVQMNISQYSKYFRVKALFGDDASKIYNRLSEI